jgi:hypothetical protein
MLKSGLRSCSKLAFHFFYLDREFREKCSHHELARPDVRLDVERTRKPERGILCQSNVDISPGSPCSLWEICLNLI